MARKRPAGPPRRGGARFRHVVGVGASAGGLAALQSLLGKLPRDFPAPVLVVLHLPPGERSHVASILQRDTVLRVADARPHEVLRPGRVYVAPPDRHLEVQGGKVRLTRGGPQRSRPSVDRLFTSLADDAEEGAIAVVLSGTGQDGAEGALRVKERDGTVVAEDRATAGFPGMPSAAVRTGAVDAVLPVDRISGFLQKVVRGEAPAIPEDGWGALLDLLRKRFGTDFTGYRASTLQRRAAKRLLATGQPDLRAYLQLVRKEPEELERLHGAFLIKVSSFFRDEEAWRDLREKVLKPLAKRASKQAPLRVWCAGCATGEEAYSLAIALTEALPPGAREHFKVYATDVDDKALEEARHGAYEPARLAALTPAQRAAHFDLEGGMYVVVKALRKRVIFGRHDLLRDPPIAKLDLLTCRNVLIYINPEQKRDVLERFLYAVRPGGYVFLGRSEGAYEVEEGFQVVSKPSRILRRTEAHHTVPVPPARRARAPTKPAIAEKRQLQAAVKEGLLEVRAHQAFQHLLLQSAGVVFITVDAQRRVTLWNRAAERLFKVKAEDALGRPIVEVADGLPTERVLRALKEAAKEAEHVHLGGLPLRVEGEATRYLDLEVAPFLGRALGGHILLIGSDATARHDAEQGQREQLQQTRKSAADLARSNESLQATNEELETLNEEMQSSSEEMQTLNEEMQSSNEELETTNEELQSTNEELNTVIEELRNRTEELERVSGFLRGVLDSAADPVLVCDTEHKVLFLNLAAARRFRVTEGRATGRDLFAVVPPLDSASVRKALARVVARPDTAAVEGLVLPEGGRLRLALSAVKDASGRVRGCVAVAADVTELWEREDAARRDRDLLALYNRLLTHDFLNLATAIGLNLELASGLDPRGPGQDRVRAAQGLLKLSTSMLRNIDMLSELRREARPRPVDASAALRRAAKLVALAFPDRDARVIDRVAERYRVMADPTLVQVFFNVLSNAVLHNTSKQPTVEVTASPSVLGRARAIDWRFEDNGPGIPPEQRERIFGGPLPDEPPEHGLGLYVTRAQVARWGGTIAAEDRGKGEGTVVRITLPRAPNGRAAKRPEKS